MPIAAIVGVIAGYTFTAMEFALLLVRTILLLTALLLVHELGLRWLRLTRRKMMVKVREERALAAGEDGDENAKIEELHKRRNLLASFCKLVVYNVLPIRVAADMFKFYMRVSDKLGNLFVCIINFVVIGGLEKQEC